MRLMGMDRAIDHALWKRAREVFGNPEAVVILTCPRCGQRSLVWSGMQGSDVRCLNSRCGLHYSRFEELLTGQEAYLAAQREKELRELQESHDTYRRVRGAIRQVRHARYDD